MGNYKTALEAAGIYLAHHTGVYEPQHHHPRGFYFQNADYYREHIRLLKKHLDLEPRFTVGDYISIKGQDVYYRVTGLRAVADPAYPTIVPVDPNHIMVPIQWVLIVDP